MRNKIIEVAKRGAGHHGQRSKDSLEKTFAPAPPEKNKRCKKENFISQCHELGNGKAADIKEVAKNQNKEKNDRRNKHQSDRSRQAQDAFLFGLILFHFGVFA